MDSKIKTLIADDHPLITDSLVELLLDEELFDIVAVCSNGLDAWLKFESEMPDLAILDISMEGIDGIELAEKIKSANNQTKVLILTTHTAPWILAKAKKAKPDGILLKNTPSGEITSSIKRILLGEIIYSPEIITILKSSQINYNAILSLTTRELEVLKLVAQGTTTNQIAEKLFLSINTIETYRKNLLFKFEAPNVAYLIKRATEIGLL